MYKYPIVNNLYVCVPVCCNRKRKSSFLNFSCHIFSSKLQTVLSSSPTLSLLAVTLLLLLETSEPKHSPTPWADSPDHYQTLYIVIHLPPECIFPFCKTYAFTTKSPFPVSNPCKDPRTFYVQLGFSLSVY
ncbi:hypothetical protein OWV82_023959 [Melia azedarach]|uniref:Uncharacterized protein n=1 Tax=Melia azedarach TaxID=155640 RepID=A0ACC1WNB8_MELAZ|nr:hypothetical protein OWV82_023959 [Melia azedarach]